jgi:hypothetical protein
MLNGWFNYKDVSRIVPWKGKNIRYFIFFMRPVKKILMLAMFRKDFIFYSNAGSYSDLLKLIVFFLGLIKSFSFFLSKHSFKICYAGFYRRSFLMPANF